MKILRNLLAILLLFGLGACGTKVDAIQIDDRGDFDPADATYCGLMQEVFMVCTNCHSSQLTGDDRNGAPAGVNWNTYDLAILNATIGNFRVQDGEMPPAGSGFGPLSQRQKQIFQAWIDNGRPEGVCDPVDAGVGDAGADGGITDASTTEDASP